MPTRMAVEERDVTGELRRKSAITSLFFANYAKKLCQNSGKMIHNQNENFSNIYIFFILFADSPLKYHYKLKAHHGSQ